MCNTLLMQAISTAKRVQIKFYTLFGDRVPPVAETFRVLSAVDISAAIYCIEENETGWMGDAFLLTMSRARAHA